MYKVHAYTKIILRNTCMYYDHSTCMYYAHSTCTYYDHSTCTYYDHSTCTYYDHSTCMYYEHSTCMHYDYNTCTFYDQSTCMYYDHSTCMSYAHSIHAFTMIIVHVSCSPWLMQRVIKGGGSGGISPRENRGFGGALGPTLLTPLLKTLHTYSK